MCQNEINWEKELYEIKVIESSNLKTIEKGIEQYLIG